tara:strand:+ start:989 stop:1300 length:312 start_codon:yes stop_codon:yes gene_type:complete
MAEFSLQGDLSITGTVLVTGSSAIPLTKVLTLSFNNPLAYVLTLEKYDALTASTIVLYEITLAAGDTVNDTLTYALNAGDTLTVYSDIPGTSYYIYGFDYASN